MNTATILLLASALTGADGEHLGAPPLAGFVTGYEAADPRRDAAIREEVPQGETVEAWSRMITTQRFGGLSDRTQATAFAGLVASRMAAACPGTEVGGPVGFALDGRPAARVTVRCPLLAETGKSETILMVAVIGSHDLHVKQVAFRGGQTARDLAWAQAWLARLRLCRAADQAAPCAD